MLVARMLMLLSKFAVVLLDEREAGSLEGPPDQNQEEQTGQQPLAFCTSPVLQLHGAAVSRDTFSQLKTLFHGSE